jgi:Fe2+ transport system protein FeoA
LWVIVMFMNVMETFSIHEKPEAEPGCDTCRLNRMQSGVAVRIRQLCGAPEVQSRLREIGLGEDQIIKLLTSHGNFICQVCNTRLAISEQLAQLILVEPVRHTARR